MFSSEGKPGRKVTTSIAVVLGLVLSVLLLLPPGPGAINDGKVQGENMAAVTRAIAAVGGETTLDLHIVNPMGARHDLQQAVTIASMRGSSAFMELQR